MPNVFAPALLIGLGGSGTDIIRRFKRRFRETSGNTPYIRFLGIDTAPQTAATSDVPQLTEGEFVHAANFNSEFFVGKDYLDQHPTIRAWWQGYRLPARMIQQGAGMRRPFGRLALFVHYTSIHQRLMRHLSEIFNNDVVGDLPPNYRRVINVYIASSTCGGTGTGMFLDMAYLTAALVPQVMPNVTPHVRGILLTPSAFIGTNALEPTTAQSLQSNAYGALSELDACMCRRLELPPLQFPDGPHVSRKRAPFATCFLLGNQTADGALFTELPELLEHAAIQLQIDLASPLDQDGRSRMDNILTDLAVLPDAKGKPRLYSSFSNEWIELPSRRIIARWTKALALQVLARLMGAGTAGEVPGALEHAAALKRLSSLIAGQGLNSYLPQVSAESDHFMDIPSQGADPGRLLDRANALQSAAHRQIEQNSALVALVEDNLTQVSSEVREGVNALVPTTSLGAVREFLREAMTQVNGWADSARAASEHADSSAWLRKFAEDVSASRKGVLQKAEVYAQRQRELVIDALEQARDGWRRALRAKLSGRILERVPGILVEIRRLAERTDQARAVAGASASAIEGMIEPVLSGSTDSTASDSEIDAAFQDPARLERLELAIQPHLRDLLSSPELTAATFAAKVWAAANSAVRTVAPEFLSRLDIPADAIAARLARLSPLAVFRQDFGASPEAGDVRRLWLVGLPESSHDKQETIRSALPAEIATITQFVPHGDQERVIMTVQHHGFPLYAMAETGDCARAFQNSSPVDQTLRFTLPDDAIRSWKLIPLDSAAAKRWFAVALATDHVRRAGSLYLLRDSATDFELAAADDPNEARRAARDSFLKGGFASDIERKCQARLASEGNKPLYEALQEWVVQQQEYGKDPSYPEEFRQDVEQVQQYLKTIRPF